MKFSRRRRSDSSYPLHPDLPEINIFSVLFIISSRGLFFFGLHLVITTQIDIENLEYSLTNGSGMVARSSWWHKSANGHAETDLWARIADRSEYGECVSLKDAIIGLHSFQPQATSTSIPRTICLIVTPMSCGTRVDLCDRMIYKTPLYVSLLEELWPAYHQLGTIRALEGRRLLLATRCILRILVCHTPSKST